MAETVTAYVRLDHLPQFRHQTFITRRVVRSAGDGAAQQRAGRHQRHLLYWDGNFLQYIEGRKDQIDPLMARIKRDPRHRGITILQREEIAAPAFPSGRWPSNG